MSAPEKIEERFTFEAQVGRGAFGEVYRGVDRASGRPVAIKRLLVGHGDPTAVDRFDREARLIAQVQSPYVVRYVAHGQDALNKPCLVLEWLEGEDLKRRGRRQPLTLFEAVEVARQGALGLEALHACGIVHRDVKPSNFFLLASADDALEVKILDLGTARGGGETPLTVEGWAVGTPAYMSPEQARGERNITARSDVFSLGVVLFELCAGKRPFIAGDNYALLAKIVLEDAPRLFGRVSGVSEDLDRIVARAMAKRPDARFRSAREMGEALALARPASVAIATAPTEELPTEVLRATMAQSLPSGRGVPRVSTLEEQRVVTALFAALDQSEDLAAATDAVVAAVTTRGGATHTTLGSRVIGVFGNARSSGDEVVRAASAALEAALRVPEARLAIATGRVHADAEGVSGEVLERAATLGGAAGTVRVDTPTARLLQARFVLEGPDGSEVLVAERDALDVPQTLLGKRTTCVGRDRELAVLEGIWTECVSERVARVALVTAAPGAGKSRLIHELVGRIVASSLLSPPTAPPAGAPPGSLVSGPVSSSSHGGPEILHARGESVGAGAPFGMIAPLVRRAARITEGDSGETRRRKLRARVARTVRGPEVDRILALLGELCGVPPAEEDRAALSPLRSDPLVLGDAMRAAFCDWLAAETTARPVVVVLDDLHWGDLPSVRFVDSALRQLRDQPLMVLALARPEVHAHFPALWSERAVHEIRLGPLTRRASEKLVREVLGEEVAAAAVTTIVDRADGNAFYLEELIRAVAGGAGEALPDTVLGMVQARLDALGPEAKRVLRAASVFGSTFSLGGVVALLGGEARATATTRVLEDLCAREVLVEQRTVEMPGEGRYAFRHALVREAAYAILTETDRELGHRLAGDWLERTGGIDAAALAEHFRRGGQPDRAVVWFRRAAEQALEGNDFAEAIERGARGLALGASGEGRGALLLAQAEAHVWRGELDQAERVATEAAASLPQGSAPWFRAVSQVVVAAGRRGLYDRVAAWLVQATDAGGPGSGSARVASLGHGAMHLCDGGMLRAAYAVMAKAEALARETTASTPPPSSQAGPSTDRLAPGALAQVHLMRARRDLLRGDPFASLVGRQLAVAALEQAQDKRQAAGARVGIGQVLVELGEARAAEEVLTRALADSEAMGLHDTAAQALTYLAAARLRLGKLDEARQAAGRAIETGRAQQNRRLEGLARVQLALTLLSAGDLRRADEEARTATTLLDIAPPARALACAALARVLLVVGNAQDAVAWARMGHSVLDAMGGSLEEGEIAVRLALVESLEASGAPALARGALVAACARVNARADGAPDPMRRQAFLTTVAENVRALALHSSWQLESGY